MTASVAPTLHTCWPLHCAGEAFGSDPVRTPDLHWLALGPQHLPVLAEVDKTAYSHPWSERHFAGSLDSGHLLQALVCQAAPVASARSSVLLPGGLQLLGYLVALQAADEVHLLNLTTVPACQRQGWGRRMVHTLTEAARGCAVTSLWLEVRASNAPALALYRSCGFQAVGRRKGYYPDTDTQREDAIVMTLPLSVPLP